MSPSKSPSDVESGLATAPCTVLRDLLHKRHSCRAFKSEEVPAHIIESMLTLAQRTASWCNTQPWKIYLSSGTNTVRLKEKLARAAREHSASPDHPFPPTYEGEHLDRRRAAGFQLYAAAGISRGDREASREQALRNFDLFDAPHCLVLTMPRYLGLYAAVDCGGWIANFLLAAQAHGVAAIAQAALAQQAPTLRSHFSIPDELAVVCGISFGFENTSSALNTYRTSRAPWSDACEWHVS